MGDDGLPLPQEFIRHGNAFIEQPAWIFPQVDNQPFDRVLAEPVQCGFELMAGVFVELIDIHVGDARLQPQPVLHALARNLVAYDVERQRLFHAVPHDDDLHRRSARAFQQVGDFGGGQIVGFLVVDFDNHVARPQAGAIGGRSGEGRQHDGLAVARLHLHADAVVVALLLFAQQLEIARIEEIGVRVERAQHARDSAFVDGFVGNQRIGEILFDELVKLGESLQAGADAIFVGGGGCHFDARPINAA